MLVPNQPMQLLLPGGQPSVMFPHPQQTGQNPTGQQVGVNTGMPAGGAKSGDLIGLNPWNLGVEELQALVNQFRFSGAAVPGPESQPPAPVSGAPSMPTGTQVPIPPANGQQPPPGPAVAPPPNPLAPNEVKTDESPKPREGDNFPTLPNPVPEAAQNVTDASGDASRKRNVVHDPMEHQHNTIETRFSQSPTKMNVAAMCEGVAAAKAPACVSDHKWEEVMRQEIDCGLARKREWRCYCGFFEGDEQQPHPLIPQTP